MHDRNRKSDRKKETGARANEKMSNTVTGLGAFLARKEIRHISQPESPALSTHSQLYIFSLSLSNSILTL